jgi:hypothetical protein
MTYRQLAEKINSLSEEWQNADISILHDDEFFSGANFGIDFFQVVEGSDADGILDIGHPVLAINP